jgi:hypothetical protein
MLVFQMRDPTPIEAYVLAEDYDRAFELFEMHLTAHGGDPDTLLWRQWELENLGEPEQSVVGEAIGLRREGLLTCDAQGWWVFTTPLGSDTQAG